MHVLWKQCRCNAHDAMIWNARHEKKKKKENKTKEKNPTMKEISYRISGKGKSWSYEYGKLYPGRYNTPPLQEDLVPRSRMAPEGKGRGRWEVNQVASSTTEWNHEPWEVEQLEMNEIANNPLEKRNKEHYENLKVAKTWMTSTMDKKELKPLWLKRDKKE